MKNVDWLIVKEKVIKEILKSNERIIRKKALEVIRKRHKELENEINLDRLRENYLKIKNFCINNIDELKIKAFKRLRSNGCRIYEVKSPKEVISLIKNIMDGKILVKSKTNVSKEIDLQKELNKNGIDVIETDLGDRIIQLAGLPSAHPILPSLCISKEYAYELITGRKLLENEDVSIEDTIKVAREGLKEKILKASTSLTGANVITAEEGFIGLVENEGNQRLITSLTKKHIVITSIDKIIPNAQDAITIMKAASYFGLGTRTAGYFSFISGPSKTGDIESTICYGMHGPEEVHIIFIDNHRSDILNSEFSEILKCCSCGGCVNYCPTYEEIGGNSFGNLMAGGRGILFSFFVKGAKYAFENGLSLCTTCGICTWSCPSKMEIAELIMKAREFVIKEGFIVPKYREILNSIHKFNNPFKEDIMNRVDWSKDGDISISVNRNRNRNRNATGSDVLLFLGCMSSFRVKNQAIYTWKLLEELNINFDYLGINEPCCGGILYRIGFRDHFNKKMEENIKIFNNYKEIILICPGCYSTFMNFYSDKLKNIKIRHIVEIISESPRLNYFKTNKIITYHDPCHLSRDLMIIDPPRKILKSIAEFKEMNLNSIMSRCCGSGGGVMASNPELARLNALARIKDACSIQDLEYLLTSCPFCEFNLKLNIKDIDKDEIGVKDFKITSIQEFMMKNKKGNIKKSRI
ncbi:MAG: LUD domain-containing protein [Candidatus Helarchaeota archaeon]